jgi:hypothetical protein
MIELTAGGDQCRIFNQCFFYIKPINVFFFLKKSFQALQDCIHVFLCLLCMPITVKSFKRIVTAHLFCIPYDRHCIFIYRHKLHTAIYCILIRVNINAKHIKESSIDRICLLIISKRSFAGPPFFPVAIISKRSGYSRQCCIERDSGSQLEFARDKKVDSC